MTLVLTPPLIAENGGSSAVTATLDRPSSAATTVTVSAAPVSPAVAGDYALSANTTLTIPADSLASTGVVTVTAVDNTVYEGDKTVTVSATAENDQSVTAPDNVTLTITENDAAPVVTVAAETAEVTEGEDAVFVLTRASAGITAPLAVDFTLADPDTVLDQEAPVTATIPAGETTVRVALATDDDAAHEEAATLTLTLTDGDAYDLGSASSATVTVRDDDPPGQELDSDAAVTVAADRAEVTEGENAVFTLTRTGDSSAELAVTIALTGGDGVLADAPPTEATFAAGAATTQVTLATNDDEVDEPNAALTLTVTDGDAYYPGTPSSAEVTVQDDDDTPTVTLVLTPASITEAGGKSTVTATLDRASSAATTVTVTAAPVDPAVSGDYAQSGTALTIAAGETTSTGEVTITAVNNDMDAADKEVTVSATATNDQGITNPDAVTLTITDDEVTVVTVAAETATITEGEEAAFTLTRVGDLSGELAVAFGVTGGGTVLTDTPPTGATFGANAATVRVALATEDDRQDEPNAALTLALTDGDAYDLGTPSEAGVTVEDDDGPPAVTLVLTPASIGENGGSSTVTATLDRLSSAATTVTVSATPVSPALAGDYALSANPTLTIPADSLVSTGVVTITAVNNDVDAADKVVTVSATATNDQGVTAPQDVTLTITDDDAPGLSIGDASVAEGDDGESATLTFTVTLSPAATLPVTVDWETADGTATAGTDYAEGNGTLTFETGDETKTVTVTVAGDDADEPNETLTVTLSNAPGATITDATATGTITDDDGPPAVTLVLNPASITEAGGSSTVTATLDRPSSAATTVTVSATPVSPALAGDYALSANTTLTIPADSLASNGVVTITAVDNAVDALDKTVTVLATATNGQGIAAPDSATLTITDDDAPSLSIADASVTEGDPGTSAMLTFTVTLDPAATLPVTVDWETADGTAEAGMDYTAGSGTLTFNAGDETKTIAVTVTGDDADEPNETLTVTLSNASGATLADAAATGTITDDDDAPTVTLVLTPPSITENGGKSTVTATLDRPSSAATTVTVSATPVSPAAAGDYALSANTILTITAGQTASAGVVTITAVNNDVDAADKTVTVSATATNGQGITAPQNVTLTITDDDAPSLSIADAGVTEGDDGESATLTFTVTLAPAATLPVTVDWATSDGTATAGTDYAEGSGTLTFNAGDESKTISVTVTGDDADEPNETLTVTLSNAPGATLADAAATGTITDDDGPPAVTLVLTPASITENGGTSTVTATLDRPSSAATTVTVSAAPVSPAAAGDYALSADTTLTIAAGQTASAGVVTITAVNNDVDAADKTVTVSATAANSQGITAPDNATLTIEDDDAPSLSIADASVAEGDDGETATLTFTVTLTPAATLPVTADWETADGTATAGTDYAAGSGTLTFNAGDESKTISVTVAGDDVDEPNETLTVTLSNAPGATLGKATGTGTITDDDGPPAVTLVLTPASITENGGSSTVTATLDRPSSAGTTVTVSAAPVSPAVANDYALSANPTLTIPADSLASTGVVTITAADNTVYEGDKTVTVSATAANDQGVTAPDNATLTITENDAAPVVTVAAETAEVTEGEEAVFVLTRAGTDVATPLAVDFTLADPDAVLDQEAPTTTTIPAGETTVRVALTTDDDAAHEEAATLTLTLTDGDLYDLGSASSAAVTVRDNDPPGQDEATDAAVTVVAEAAEVTEGEDAVFTLTRTGDSTAGLAVTFAVTGDLAVLAAAPPTEATFGAGADTTRVALATDDDEVDEPHAKLTLTVTDGEDYYPGEASEAEVTVEDDDGPPAVTLVLTPPSISENGGSSTVTATLDRPSSAATTVTVSAAPVSPAAAGDYALSANPTLTVPADSLASTGVVTITAVNNDVDAADKTVTVSATAENDQGITAPQNATLTIEDDDAPALSISDAGVTEGDDGETATLTFTVTLSPAATLPVTVDWETADGTATAGTDYTAGSGTLTFEPGDASRTVSVTVTGDDADEPNETLTVTLSNAPGATLVDAAATGTITDDDDAPTVTLVLTPPSITENGGSSTVTATLDRPSSAATTVTVSATPVSPAAAGDYALSANMALTIAPGQTASTGVVTITAADNAVDAADKTVTVSATAANSQGITAPQNATLTITDDDAPSLSIADASVAEGDDGETATLTFTVTLSPAATLPVTADWETSDGTATAGTDYTAGSGTLTFNAGDETKTISVTVAGDDADEPNETLTVTLSNAPGATIGKATGTGTITDDDGPPAVTLVLTPASIAEDGGGSTVTATLDRPSSADTTVTVSAAPVSPAVAGDYTLSTNTTLTIPAGQTTSTGEVKITAVNNDVDALDKTVTVSATATNGQGITAPQNVTLTIEDDDAPALSIGDASVAEGDDGETATLTFTVTLAPAATLPVTVDWRTADGTATAGTDYTAGNGSLTFETGDASRTVAVTVAGDDADEPNETLTVTLSNAPGATIGKATGTGTIMDDDGPPAVTLVLTPVSIAENGGKSTVTATLDRPSSAATTVTVSAAPVSPAAAGDYALSANTALTIAAGQTASTGVVTITAADNAVDAADKTVTVSATAANSQGITAPQNATLTITDDDAPSLSIADASVAEGDDGETATLTFTVTLSPAATLPVTADWETSDGTATAGTDYTAANGGLTFETGDETRTISVTVAGDDADEPNETLTVTLSNAPGATLADATATGTITDDDGPPAVTLVLTPPSIGESGGKSAVTATLDRPSSAATMVTVSAAPVDPAVAGDYTLAGSQLTIAAGQTASTGTVTITATDNAVDALDKTVTVSATATNGQGITAPDNATLTIEDDDAPALSIGDASVTEGDDGETATLTFTVTLSPAATLPVTVDWRTADGTATAGTDYTAGNGSLTFETGDASRTVAVTVAGDDADEPNETLTVTLSNAPGATIGKATGTGTITDDDGPPAVTLVLTPPSIGESGGKSAVTATLDRPSSAATMVTVSAAPVDPAVAGDYTLAGSQLTIAAGQTASTGTVTITATDNAVDALDKAVTVSATAANDQGVTAPDSATLTITDDDAPALSIGDASVAEGDDGETATLTFTVTLSPAATLPVTVDWRTADGTATAGTDYTAGNGSLTFETGDASRTVAVTVAGDDADEPNETLTVTLSNAPGAMIGKATGTGTITDDDGPPAVTLVLTPPSIAENGGTSAVTATLDRPSGTATIVTVSAAPVSPAVAGDYTLAGSQLTIAAGQTASAGEVTITAVDNDVDAADREVMVSATAENTQGVTAPDSVTLTIEDDDAPSLSIADAGVAEGNRGESPTMTFTVTLSPAATLPVTVDWATSDGTATAGTDYTAGNGTLTFDTGDETRTISVTVAGDDADEPNETLTVTLSNESGATIGKATATGTITDDDGPPAVTLVLTPASIAEDGGTSAVTATLDRASSAATTVTVSAAPVAPAVAGDYALSAAATLTIAAGQTTSTGVVTIAAVNNDVDAADKTVTVSATAENTQGVTAPDSATLTITDDDAPALSIGDASMTEGDDGETATLTFTVTLSPAATLPVTVDWRTADGTATAGTDYTAGNGSLTFETGDASRTVAVTVAGDDADEPNETLTVTLSNAPGATIGKATGTGTITDDDGPPAVTLVLTPPSIAENGGTSAVTATLDRPSGTATIVTVSAAPVSPAVAGDYTLAGSQLTIAAGQTASAGEVTITAVDNDVDAADREVMVSATAENTQGVTAPDSVTLTIEDDDAPSLSIADAGVAEGNRGESPTMTFTVTLSPAATLPVTVDWTTADGTAEAGTDYTAGSGTLTFDAGENTGTVAVTVMGDDADEPNETLTVTLSNAAGATLADATATGTITDDDAPVRPPPSLSIADAGVAEGDDGESPTMTFTVTLAPAAGLPVTVDWATSDGTAIAGADYTAANGSLTFNTGDDTGTVAVAVAGDIVDEPDETFRVTLSNAAGATLADAAATGTIADDDATPAVALHLSPASIGENGGLSAVTATLDRPSGAATTVTVSAAPVPPAVAGDYSLSANTTLTIAAGATESAGLVTIAAVDNDADGPDRTVTVSAAAANTRGVVGPRAVALTIVDDDDAPLPALSIGDAGVAEGDSGGEALTFAVTLDRAAPGEVTVDWATADGTAEAGSDYAAANGSLTFDTGENAGTVAVTVAGDIVDEPDETFRVTLSNAAGATLGDAMATGTIADDDATPAVTLVLTPASIAENGGVSAVTATLDRPSGAATAVTVTAAPVPPAVAGDYALGSNTTLTIAAGATESAGRVTIAAVDNDADGPDRTVTVSAAAANGLGVVAPRDATLTIEDDDAPVVTASAETAAVTEGEAVVFVLTRAGDLSEALAVSFDVTGGGAVLRDAPPAEAAFGADGATARVALATEDDPVDEADADVALALRPDAAYRLGDPSTAVVRVRDNDDRSAVTVAAVAERIPEGEAAEFELRRTGGARESLTAVLEVSERGGDMVSDALEGARRVTFEAGATTALLRVATADDGVPGPDSRVTVAVSEGGGAYDVGWPRAATVAVADAGGPSALARGRRSGASALLGRHARRFSRLTSGLALARLGVGRGASAGVVVGGDGAAAPGVGADVPPPFRGRRGAPAADVDVGVAGDGGEIRKRIGGVEPAADVGVAGDGAEARDHLLSAWMGRGDAGVHGGGADGAAVHGGAVADDPPPPPPPPGVDGGGNPLDAAGAPLGRTFYFEFDRARLSEGALRVLAMHANHLRDFRDRGVSIEGHCDERGPREYNLGLGERRARAVERYLVSAGVRESQIEIVSHGEERPANPGQDERAWSENRRAVLVYRCRGDPAVDAGVRGDGAAANGDAADGPPPVRGRRGVSPANAGVDGVGATVPGGVADGPLPVWGRHGVSMLDVGVRGGRVRVNGGVAVDPPSVRASRGAPVADTGLPGGGVVDGPPLFRGRHGLSTADAGVHGGGVAAPGGVADVRPPVWGCRGFSMPGAGVRGGGVAVPGGVADGPSPVWGRHGFSTADAGVCGDGFTLPGGVAHGSPVRGGRGASTADVNFHAGGVAAHGDVAVDLPLAWGGRSASTLDVGVDHRGGVVLGGDVRAGLPLGPGDRGAATMDVSFDRGGVAANGDVAVALPPGWDGWGSVRYSRLAGAADGGAWDVYAGADRLGADGRAVFGGLIGYEPGRVTSEGVRLEAGHVQLGVYGARRLTGRLTVDGALGWGRGAGDLSLAGGPRRVTASYRSERFVARADATGDFGWGGGALRVEPQIGLLYAGERLGGFTDSEGGTAPPERLWLARLGFGPRLAWERGNVAVHARLRVHLDAHNLGASAGRRREVSASLELGHRWRLDEGNSLDLSASLDGLGSGWFSSASFGLTYESRF